MALVLDSGGVSRLAERSRQAAALLQVLRDDGLWPPRVPSLLRRRARRGSAVDALVVAFAEPDGSVLTSDPEDLEALASHAEGVTVVRL